MESFLVLLILPSSDSKSLNIYYFYQYSPSHMQKKSSNLHSHTHPNHLNQSLLNSHTPLEHKEVLPLKIAFTNWIKTMPMEERFVAAKIYAPGLSHAIRSIFWQRPAISLDRNLQYQTFRLDSLQQINYCQPKKPLSKLQKHLLQSLAFISDGHDFLDNLCFDFSLLECPQRLFDMLTCNVKHQHVRLVDQALNSRRNAATTLQMIHQLKIKEPILEQLFTFMRQSVLLNFRNSLKDPTLIPRLLQQQKQRKKDFSIFWRNISHQHRENILLLQCKDVAELIAYLQKRGVSITQQVIDKEIGELLSLEKNEFCNKIFKCKLKKAMNPLFDYYEHIYSIWKKDVVKNKKKKYNKNRRERDYNSQQKCEQKQTTKTHKKKDKNRKSTSVESNQTNQTQHQRIFAQNSRSNGSVQKREASSTLTQHEKSIERQQMLTIKDKKTMQVTLQQKVVQKLQLIQEVPTSQISIMIKKQREEYLDCHTPGIQKNKSIQTAKIQQQIAQEAIIKASLEKLEQQLEEMSDEISEEANFYHQRRVIAFQRIQFLLSYYNIPIKLFGSCANGIAVKNSDIDIAIDQAILTQMQFIPQCQKVRVALQNLQQLFMNYPTFKEIKVIKTAAIPVMKLTIDTSIPFLGPEYGQIYQSLNRGHNYGPIHADVTIQTANKQNQSSHLGIHTTSTISDWLSSIKSLRSIVIVMKSFLTISGLNLSYEGGLNTFAMIVMLVSYIKDKKLEYEQNAAVILRDILHFYGQEFDENQYGIDLQCNYQNKIYFKKQRCNGSPSKTMKADLQIIDPICQSKNMTRNCYLYPEIKKLFKSMLKSCFLRADKQLSQTFEGEPSLEKLTEHNKLKFAQRNVFRQLQNSITTHF